MLSSSSKFKLRKVEHASICSLVQYRFRLVSAPDNAVYGWDQNIFLQRVYSLGILFFRMKKISYCSSVRPDN